MRPEAASPGTAPCTANETCNESVDVCEVPPECVTDADCSDGAFCNGTEFCDALGSCQAGSAPCAANETCNETADLCEVPPECLTNADCDDGTFCDGAEFCDAAGSCQPGAFPCEANQICDEAARMCVLPPECNVDADCHDGLFCTGVEICAAGTCQLGALPCAPGESCDEANAVLHSLPTEPDIDVTPLSLDFGVVEIGMRRTLEIRIANRGDWVLLLRDVAVTGSPDFTVVPLLRTVPAFGSMVVEVRYTRTRASGTAALSIFAATIRTSRRSTRFGSDSNRSCFRLARSHDSNVGVADPRINGTPSIIARCRATSRA